MTNSFKYTHFAVPDSSFTDGVWYNFNTRTLVIETSGGESLTYTGVPPEVFDELSNASSAGRFYQDNIKGVYTYIPGEEYSFFTPDFEGEPAPTAAPAVDDDVSEDADNNFRYGVNAYFKDFEQAYILFSYAEALGTQVTLTAFNDLGDDDE